MSKTIRTNLTTKYDQEIDKTQCENLSLSFEQHTSIIDLDAECPTEIVCVTGVTDHFNP